MNVQVLLAFFAGAAITLAVHWFSRTPDQPVLQPDTIARVGDATITLDMFTSRLANVTGMQPADVPLAERKATLQAMVEEQLLHQHVSGSGLLHRDEQIFSLMQRAVEVSLDAPEQTQEATDEELRRFYAEQGAQFRVPSRVALDRMVFRGSRARLEADLAHARLENGEPFVSVKAQVAGPDLMSLPPGALSAQEWEPHLGAVVAQAIATLPRDHFTEPLPAEGGYVIMQVTESVAARKPALADVRKEVESAWQRAQQAGRLRELLRELQMQTDVQFNEALVEALETTQ